MQMLQRNEKERIVDVQQHGCISEALGKWKKSVPKGYIMYNSFRLHDIYMVNYKDKE